MDKKLRLIYIKSISYGFLGAGFFAFLYFMVFNIFMSLDAALYQVKSIMYWLIILLVGFGVQISLFVYIKLAIKHKAENLNLNGVLAATGGVNAASMLACCMHHLSDFLIILGIGFLSAFALKFQTWFLLLGILSNLFGILFMLKHIKKHKLTFGNEEDIISKIAKFDLIRLNKIYLFTSIIILIIYGGILFI